MNYDNVLQTDGSWRRTRQPWYWNIPRYTKHFSAGYKAYNNFGIPTTWRKLRKGLYRYGVSTALSKVPTEYQLPANLARYGVEKYIKKRTGSSVYSHLDNYLFNANGKKKKLGQRPTRKAQTLLTTRSLKRKRQNKHKPNRRPKRRYYR